MNHSPVDLKEGKGGKLNEKGNIDGEIIKYWTKDFKTIYQYYITIPKSKIILRLHLSLEPIYSYFSVLGKGL